MRSIRIATNMDQMDHSSIRSIRAFFLGSKNVPSSTLEKKDQRLDFFGMIPLGPRNAILPDFDTRTDYEKQLMSD